MSRVSRVSQDAVTPNPVLPGDYLCYINGLCVPIAGATVQYGVGQVPECSINFYPSKLMRRFGAEDRVEVVLFYLDNHYAPDKPEYRLLFEGEIVSWSYSTSGEGRSMTATAVADISIFNQVQYSLLNTVGRVANATLDPNESNTVTQAGVYYGYSLFQYGLLYQYDSASTPVPSIRRPYDLLFNAVRGLADRSVAPGQRSIPVVNFYSRWARRRNYINRFVASAWFDDPIAEADGVFPIFKTAKAMGALKTMQDSIAQAGADGNLYEILTRAFQSVYFEIAMLPTAPAMHVRLEDGVIEGAPGSVNFEGAAEKHPLRLANYYAKPQMLFSIPPMCNVLFPSMIKSIQYQENFRVQPTRIYLNDEFVANLLPSSELAINALTLAYPPEAKAAVAAQFPATPTTTVAGGAAGVAAMAGSGRNLLIWPEEFFKGPVAGRGLVPEFYGALIRKIGQDQAAGVSSTDDSMAANINILLDVFAEYEFYRTRYEQRGGAADLTWNPYIVPGYPCVLFDRRGGLDQVGYVNTVMHSLSPTGMSTSINYAYGRTLNEWMALLKNEIERLGVVIGSAPAEPLDSVRQRMQNFDHAEQYYNTLFHRREDLTKGKVKRKASFDLREVIATQDDAGNVSAIQISDTPTEDAVPLQARPIPVPGAPGAATAASPTRPQPSRVAINYQDEVVPSKAFKEIFENTADALTFTARPICTLDEYLLFLHGETNIGQLRSKQPALFAASNRFKHSSLASAEGYWRIKTLSAPPVGFTPPPTAVGVAASPPTGNTTQTTATIVTQPPTAVNAAWQTRANWDAVLLGYRDEVEKYLTPLE